MIPLAEPTTPAELDTLTAKVADYVKAPSDAAYVRDCTAEALALVDQHIGRTTTVPGPIRTRAVVEAAAELFWRKQARAGVVEFGGQENGTELVHVATDPLRAVRPLLRPYLPGGFA